MIVVQCSYKKAPLVLVVVDKYKFLLAAGQVVKRQLNTYIRSHTHPAEKLMAKKPLSLTTAQMAGRLIFYRSTGISSSLSDSLAFFDFYDDDWS